MDKEKTAKKERDFSSISFEDISFDDVKDLEEVITPGQGTVNCCN